MKKSFGSQSLIYPMPVLIICSYDENGNVDAMNAAWGGIHDTNQIGICLSHEHKSADNILLKKAFTVSFADEAHVAECDFVGIVSAKKDPDKIKKSGFTFTRSEKIDAPVCNELPVALECSLVSYDEKSDYLVADIVNVLADEEVLTDGKIDPSKAKPITFDAVNNKYIALGKIAGNAFKDGLKLR